ncbi:MAG: hypothetical protein LBQ11_02280 [Candidatus Nomurabacteria bacterium]|jgi:hypothetical protein|nr:hypothetical protein [Candidatus Nomurabacteria bacterium]
MKSLDLINQAIDQATNNNLPDDYLKALQNPHVQEAIVGRRTETLGLLRNTKEHENGGDYINKYVVDIDDFGPISVSEVNAAARGRFDEGMFYRLAVQAVINIKLAGLKLPDEPIEVKRSKFADLPPPKELQMHKASEEELTEISQGILDTARLAARAAAKAGKFTK